jgi:hypothetical protein
MSQFAAVTWKVKPGFDEELARLFENYPRPESFVFTVRLIEYEGECAGVMLHMAGQRAIRELEELGTEFVEVPRDTSSPTAFREFFLAHSMRYQVAWRHDQPAAVVSEVRGDR